MAKRPQPKTQKCPRCKGKGNVVVKVGPPRSQAIFGADCPRCDGKGRIAVSASEKVHG